MAVLKNTAALPLKTLRNCSIEKSPVSPKLLTFWFSLGFIQERKSAPVDELYNLFVFSN